MKSPHLISLAALVAAVSFGVVGLALSAGDRGAEASTETLEAEDDRPTLGVDLRASTDSSDSEDEWTHWFDEAMEEADETGKPVLAHFTGSDWCPPCLRQHAEIFSKEAFYDWAEENVVLLELDFPRGKEQSDELKAQNRELQKHYKVTGYPTILVLTPDGQEVQRYISYRPGMGVEKWIERTQEAVDEAREAAEADEDAA